VIGTLYGPTRCRVVRIDESSLTELDVLKLGFVHPKVVSQFVEHGLPDLMTDFGLVRADRLNIFLVEDDAVRSLAKVKHTFLGGR
jgi:hypothetical protein